MNDNFLTEKVLTGENVLRAAIARIEWIFETFPSVCLSFSGGKDYLKVFCIKQNPYSYQHKGPPNPGSIPYVSYPASLCE